MDNFSYTISPSLRQELEKVDRLITDSQLILLSPLDENYLRWEGLIEKIHGSLQIEHQITRKSEIASLLQLENKKKQNLAASIHAYKDAFYMVYFNWSASPAMIDSSDIAKLYKIFARRTTTFERLENSLRFLQVNPEHPLIQAALAQLLFLTGTSRTEENLRFSCIVAYLFLTKYGYTLRHTISIENIILHERPYLEDMVKNSSTIKNYSSYLEHYAQLFSGHCEKKLEKLRNKNFDPHLSRSTFSLSSRQKEILAFLDTPDSKISNKVVQKMFGISQITASRELARLASLTLIYSVGKGRSVAYKKV